MSLGISPQIATNKNDVFSSMEYSVNFDLEHSDFHLLSLPLEILQEICLYISDDDIIFFALTCKVFHHIVHLKHRKLCTPWKSCLISLPRASFGYQYGLIPRDLTNTSICCTAASYGSLSTLQWARTLGYDWDERTCLEAARCGNVELLQWAHENGCPWDHYTCAMAANRGHLDCLMYAVENNCKMEKQTITFAIQGNQLDVLKV
jgi:hypothetical protein